MLSHKSGTDIADLLSKNYSTRIKSKRWPLSAFVFIIDACRSSAIIKELLKSCSVFLVSRKFYGNLKSKMPQQSLASASNACKELLVLAHTISSEKIRAIN